MIVLDPELDPDPARLAAVAFSRADRLPAARTLARFLALAQAEVRLRGQVTVLITTDAAIRKLNRNFRGKNKATDVLSFPGMDVPGLRGTERVAGDLAISAETARRQAAEQAHPLLTEIKVLMLHGLLHLAGYDHEVDRGQMARRERLLRARLRLPLGLIERAEAAPAAKSETRGKRTAKAPRAGSPRKKADA